jgi:PIN domain nuclease of toxin-antitoxin system
LNSLTIASGSDLDYIITLIESSPDILTQNNALEDIVRGNRVGHLVDNRQTSAKIIHSAKQQFLQSSTSNAHLSLSDNPDISLSEIEYLTLLTSTDVKEEIMDPIKLCQQI